MTGHFDTRRLPAVEDWPTSPQEENLANLNRSRSRWWTHLALLTCYPIALGVIGFFSRAGSNQPLLPTDPAALVSVMVFELLLFTVVFGAAWGASRASAEELLLRWRGGVRPVIRGLLYSIGLRLGIAIIAISMAGVLAAAGVSRSALQNLQPSTEELVNARVLVDNPLYLWLNLTLVSFVVGGVREELWRAGMFAGLAALFPRSFQNFRGKIAAAAFVGVVFGLGHLPQGWGGVLMTGILGLGLGVIMLWHRSMWEAAFAHGLFDATSFVFLYLIARFRLGLT